MQIESIGIYNAKGDRRLITFHSGLNIVTGWSGTGKSSLLDIVEFCLGRRQPTYPEGALTTAVSWFSITVVHDGTRLFIARPAPPRGRQTTQQAMIRIGVGGEDIDGSDLEVNADTKAVREQLTRLVGIPAHDVRIATPFRQPLETTIAQALFYCFQGENELTSKLQLFHRANEQEEFEAIRETLPYFLGAAELNTVDLRRQLEEARRDLRRAETRLAQQRGAAERLDAEVGALFTQARALGLVSATLAAEDPEPLAVLREVAAASLDQDSELGDAPEQYRQLRERQRQLLQRLRQTQEQAALARRFSAQRQLFEDEVDEQRSRLQTINLLPGDAETDEAVESPSDANGKAASLTPIEPTAVCPLCGSPLTGHDVSAAALHASVLALEGRLAQVADLEPRAVAQLDVLEAQVEERRLELRDVDRELVALAAADVALAETREVRSQRAYLQGRIAAYLETARPDGDDAPLERRVAELRARVAELEAIADLDEQRQRVDSILQFVSTSLTEYAQRLRLEHSEYSVRLDPELLTLIADTPTGPIALARMGSQAYIVGYHLAAHLALHRWFIERGRPVPRFVFFDQPTQPFYPDDVHSESDEVLSDDDDVRVGEWFALLREVADVLDLQIIVPDHANRPEPWFQQAVVENWRYGNALVPREWLEGP
jgi:DNA repair exonuclease SbcCD ATPase subunit